MFVGERLENYYNLTLVAREYLGPLKFFLFDEYGRMEYPRKAIDSVHTWGLQCWRESERWFFMYSPSEFEVGTGRDLLIVEDWLGRTAIMWLELDAEETNIPLHLQAEQFRWQTVHSRLSDVNWRSR